MMALRRIQLALRHVNTFSEFSIPFSDSAIGEATRVDNHVRLAHPVGPTVLGLWQHGTTEVEKAKYRSYHTSRAAACIEGTPDGKGAGAVEQPIVCNTYCGVATIHLNRPEVMNALSFQMMSDLMDKLRELDACPNTRAIIITGAGQAFCAGADVDELSSITSYSQAYKQQIFENWNEMLQVRTPIVAAINGPAYGGGMELAMSCDIVIAAEEAKFALPQLALGLIPGGGGTQRMTRRLGKARAMEMILTTQTLSAFEAERVGVVSRVVKRDNLMDVATSLAQRVATYSTPAVAKAKECINASFEMPLEEGLKFEKREFWSCFGLQDSHEGMAAFLEKRRPYFRDH